MNERSVLVLLSGGVDSTVAAALALRGGYLKACLFVNYGQPSHEHEWMAAYNWTNDNSVKFLFCNSQVDTQDMDLGIFVEGPRVVQGRNAILMSLGVNHAAATACSEVWIGASKGDQENYPDCSKLFIESFGNLCLATYGIDVKAPLIDKTRKEVVALGDSLEVDISKCWSCYQPAKGGWEPCGACDSCLQDQ